MRWRLSREEQEEEEERREEDEDVAACILIPFPRRLAGRETTCIAAISRSLPRLLRLSLRVTRFARGLH